MRYQYLGHGGSNPRPSVHLGRKKKARQTFWPPMQPTPPSNKYDDISKDPHLSTKTKSVRHRQSLLRSYRGGKVGGTTHRPWPVALSPSPMVWGAFRVDMAVLLKPLSFSHQGFYDKCCKLRKHVIRIYFASSSDSPGARQGFKLGSSAFASSTVVISVDFRQKCTTGVKYPKPLNR